MLFRGTLSFKTWDLVRSLQVIEGIPSKEIVGLVPQPVRGSPFQMVECVENFS
jgi:hypothetical protein